MAKQVKLKAERRTATGRSAARKLKARGAVPAIIYAPRINRSRCSSRRATSCDVEPRFRRNILVELEIDGEKSNRLALVKEIQHSPVGSDVCISIFMPCRWMRPFKADVPLEALGIANGVKNFGGLLEQSLRSLAIECLPRDLPDRITVDVSD